MELKDFTIKQIKQGLKDKEFSAFELTRAYLDKIKKEDKKINSFLFLAEDLAMSQAKQIDKELSEGKVLPDLAGLPMAIKDNILIEGAPCTAGSRILENYQAVYDATVIKKLKAAGAIFLGKTNLDEFAMGSSTENSAFGPTRNPNDLKRVPGGSSGGSAAAVAANLSVAALGSDTGGSIRQPASFCGVVGLKPTYGAVSRYGLIAFASSLDQIGPIAKNAEDAETIFNVIRGKDEKDSTSVDSPEKKLQSVSYKLQNYKIGVPKEYFGKGIDEKIKQKIKEVIKKAEKAGAKIKEISLWHNKYAIPVYYNIATSEASANLARFDGVRYGFSSKGDKDLIGDYMETRRKGFGAEVKRRLMLGTYALSSGYYDDYYLKAQKVRNLIKQDFDKAFNEVDAIFSPVSPILPFKMGEKAKDPLLMYLADILTVSVNLAGLPAISLPIGKVQNLPVGLQIIGKPFGEKEIFECGKAVEKMV